MLSVYLSLFIGSRKRFECGKGQRNEFRTERLFCLGPNSGMGTGVSMIASSCIRYGECRCGSCASEANPFSSIPGKGLIHFQIRSLFENNKISSKKTSSFRESTYHKNATFLSHAKLSLLTRFHKHYHHMEFSNN